METTAETVVLSLEFAATELVLQRSVEIGPSVVEAPLLVLCAMDFAPELLAPPAQAPSETVNFAGRGKALLFEAESSKVRQVPRRPFWVLLATARQEDKEDRLQVHASVCFDLAPEVARACARGKRKGQSHAFHRTSAELVSTSTAQVVAVLQCAIRVSCLRGSLDGQVPSGPSGDEAEAAEAAECKDIEVRSSPVPVPQSESGGFGGAEVERNPGHVKGPGLGPDETWYAAPIEIGTPQEPTKPAGNGGDREEAAESADPEALSALTLALPAQRAEALTPPHRCLLIACDHESGETWVTERLVLYVSGRAEATFSDGSAVILHPPNAAKASFFTSDGRRQRLLSTCSPQFGRAEVRAKIMAAAAVRDQFHPHPSSLVPVESRRKCFEKLLKPSAAVWPSHAPQSREDGSVEVSSLDGSVHLTLAPHGRTFVVQWLRPIADSSSSLQLQEVMASSENPETWPDGTFLSRSEDRAAGLHDCVQQVQCFAVQEPVEVAWVYPLLICLLRHQTCDERGDLIRGLAETLQQCQICGTVLDSGHCVTVPLPAAQIGDGAHCGSHSGDDISPAACMGTFGEGPVMLSWTPQSAIRLGHAEASVELLDLGSEDSSLCRSGYQWAFLESSLSGRFWKMVASNLEWQLPDVLCVDLLPPGPGDSPFACRLIALVEEASLWLRQNSSESVTRGAGVGICSDPQRPGPGPGPGPGSGAPAWLHEAQLEEGGACLTVFRSCERRLVRVLFAEGARMDFELEQGELSPGSNFRLLTKHGELLRRRFVEPLGAEAEVAQALRLLKKLETKIRGGPHAHAEMQRAAQAAAQAALRRTRVFLSSLPTPTESEAERAQSKGSYAMVSHPIGTDAWWGAGSPDFASQMTRELLELSETGQNEQNWGRERTREFLKALQMLLVVLTCPATCLSAIQADAYKKYVLLCLKVHGEVKLLPIYTSHILVRYSKSPSYVLDIAEAFKASDIAALQRIVEEKQPAIEADQNLGLVKQVLSSMRRHKIRTLTKTYLTLSLAEIAAEAGIQGDHAEAEAILFDMISENEIQARIDQRTGNVSFEDAENLDMDMMQTLQGKLGQIMELSQRISGFEQEVVTSESYVRKTSLLDMSAERQAGAMSYDLMDM
ncbi:cops3 [Symbiodinium sp. CCMP2456]|nr:cops3 [Symbiodinium sp. CCMP2456]